MYDANFGFTLDAPIAFAGVAPYPSGRVTGYSIPQHAFHGSYDAVAPGGGPALFQWPLADQSEAELMAKAADPATLTTLTVLPDFATKLAAWDMNGAEGGTARIP